MSELTSWLRRAGHLLTPITPGAKRAVVILFALMVGLAAANLLFTSGEVGNVQDVVRVQDAQARELAGQVAKLQRAVLSSCAFAADVGSAPVAAGPGGKVSELGVSIVADSRAQWRRLGCPGHLALPQPSFSRWARYYHLDDR